MSEIFNNVDHVIEALDDKVVRTAQGSFIKVDDLKAFYAQVHEMEAEGRKPEVRPKSFAEVRERAKQDPDIQALAQPPSSPRAPALSSVKGVTAPDRYDSVLEEEK